MRVWATTPACFDCRSPCVCFDCQAAGREGSGEGQLVSYHFHPSQPFVLVVVQDQSSGIAERLTIYARV